MSLDDILKIYREQRGETEPTPEKEFTRDDNDLAEPPKRKPKPRVQPLEQPKRSVAPRRQEERKVKLTRNKGTGLQEIDIVKSIYQKDKKKKKPKKKPLKPIDLNKVKLTEEEYNEGSDADVEDNIDIFKSDT